MIGLMYYLSTFINKMKVVELRLRTMPMGTVYWLILSASVTGLAEELCMHV